MSNKTKYLDNTHSVSSDSLTQDSRLAQQSSISNTSSFPLAKRPRVQTFPTISVDQDNSVGQPHVVPPSPPGRTHHAVPAPAPAHAEQAAPATTGFTQVNVSTSLNSPLPILAQPTVTRKRRATQKPTNNTKTPEQAEIDNLKVELNAVKTQALQLGTDKKDLEKKIKIMSEVIKMHEQQQAKKAYENLHQSSNQIPQAHH